MASAFSSFKDMEAIDLDVHASIYPWYRNIAKAGLEHRAILQPQCPKR